jgi:hypothetical protein
MESVWFFVGLLASAYSGWMVSRKRYGVGAYAALMALAAFMQAAS